MAGQVAWLVDEDVFLGLVQHGDLPGDFLLVESSGIKENHVISIQCRESLRDNAIDLKLPLHELLGPLGTV